MDLIFQALADATRRKILSMVRHDPLPAGKIAEAFAISRPAISRHLRVLREAGLLCDRDEGREKFYVLDPSALTPVDEVLAGLRAPRATDSAAWERRFMALATEVHRVRSRRKSGSTPSASLKTRKTA